MSKRAPYELDKTVGNGQVFWRSLESLENGREPLEAAEFPLRLEGPVTAKTVAADDRLDEGTLGRRSLLKLAGTAAAASTLAACVRRPVEKLVPYTRQVEYSVPGVAYHYASARVERGDVVGLLAEVHENRPTKLEGNPDHPANRGTTDLRSQASILDLYDPDRPGKISRRDGDHRVDANAGELDRVLAEVVAHSSADQGARLRLLVEPSISPTFLRFRDAFKAKFPQAKVYAWTALDHTSVREGSRLAFGQLLNAVYDFSMARTILALDSDFLQTEPGMLRATRGFVRGRQAHRPQEGMSRLYVVEPGYTTTGSNADNRLRLPARDIEGYLLALVKELATKHGLTGDLSVYAGAATETPAGVSPQWLSAVAKDLVAHRGRSIVVVGSRQPARVHALVHAVNAALGNNGESIHFYPVTDEDEGDAVADIKQLAAELDGGKVDTLVMLGGNPAYDAPADLGFAEKIGKAKLSVRLGSHLDETAVRSTWYVPRAHELEAWGDARGLDGTVSVIQPLIAPLHGGISDLQVLARLVGEPLAGGNEAIQTTLRANAKGAALANFDRVWNTALQRGLLEGVQMRPVPATPPVVGEHPRRADQRQAREPAARSRQPRGQLPGRPEAPRRQARQQPLAARAPRPAQQGRLGQRGVRVPRDGEGARGREQRRHPPRSRRRAEPRGRGLHRAGRRRQLRDAPPGMGPHPRRALRRAPGARGRRPLRAARRHLPVRAAAPPQRGHPRLQRVRHPHERRARLRDGFKAGKTGKTYKLVTTHEHHSMEGRPIAIDATLEEFKKNPDFPEWKTAERPGTPDPKVLPLWTPQEYTEHKWGMAIDLSMCTGCNACTVACQAENNIAFVGKDQVSRGREMYWIRIDRYFVGNEAADPAVAYQPVACVHCEQAPCENVCPVNATTHSPEGLNDMAYNRCVGTRYCANNCPYKVRRFNYLEFQGDPMYGDLPEMLKMQFNPNVTVRMRGVMEKCTYCVQRIEEARISSRRDGRPLKDGDIVSACAQACPADAIVFGDLNEPRSRVATLAAMGRGYRLLSELGTHPRTTHLGKIRNPNTELA